MSEPVIEVKGLVYEYKGTLLKKKLLASRDINLEVRAGEIHGFLGPNGAGKSTTIKAILGLITPAGGSVKVFGEPASVGRWRGRVGFLPENPNFPDFLTGVEMVEWYARLHGMERSPARAEAERQLERVGLTYAAERRIRSYSKGMLQRAGLAQALIGDPELLILDEPMTGLDPMGRRDVRNLIRELRDHGTSVFYSSHILPDIEMTCDRITIVNEGRTLRTGRLQDVIERKGTGATLEFEFSSEAGRDRILSEFPGSRIDGAIAISELDSGERPDRALTRILADDEVRLVRFEPHREDLESVFVAALGDNEEEVSI